MAESNINKLILVFVMGILGVIGIGIVASQILTNTQQAFTTDESISIAAARVAGNDINTTYQFTLTNAPTGWELNDADCQINNFVLTNASGTVINSGNYTLTASTGKFTLGNTTTLGDMVSNTTLADYNYCADGYVADSFGRSSLNMVSGFFALMILIVFVAAVYLIIRNMGE